LKPQQQWLHHLQQQLDHEEQASGLLERQANLAVSHLQKCEERWISLQKMSTVDRTQIYAAKHQMAQAEIAAEVAVERLEKLRTNQLCLV